MQSIYPQQEPLVTTSRGSANYSTQKVITYSDSTRKILQENVFLFYDKILNLVTKVAQTFPKSDQLLFSMQTGKYPPYIVTIGNFCHKKCFICNKF